MPPLKNDTPSTYPLQQVFLPLNGAFNKFNWYNHKVPRFEILWIGHFEFPNYHFCFLFPIFQLKKSLFSALIYPKPEKGTAFGQSLPALANTASCLVPRRVLADSQSIAPGATLVLGKGSWERCTPLCQRRTLPCCTARYSLINRSRVFNSTVEAGAQERSSTGSVPPGFEVMRKTGSLLGRI